MSLVNSTTPNREPGNAAQAPHNPKQSHLSCLQPAPGPHTHTPLKVRGVHPAAPVWLVRVRLSLLKHSGVIISASDASPPVVALMTLLRQPLGCTLVRLAVWFWRAVGDKEGGRGDKRDRGRDKGWERASVRNPQSRCCCCCCQRSGWRQLLYPIVCFEG